MQTKRKYAHELYPPADEWEVRPLSVEVPYLYARALGYGIWGTGWIDADPQESRDRILQLLNARNMALLADAIHQGMTGDEAWAWAAERYDEAGEIVYDRALHYGVPDSLIKPYPCGPEPTTHYHMESTGDVMGIGLVTVIGCPESECETCTEPVDVAGRDLDSASDLTRVLDAEALDVPTEEPPAGEA